MCGPFIGVAIMDIKEEDLGCKLASSIVPTEETRCLHPDIPVHMPPIGYDGDRKSVVADR